jgi:ribonucleoside-diphosphate reductase beta chain
VLRAVLVIGLNATNGGNMSNMMVPRMTYSPFEYPEAYEFWVQQQSSHWLANEISFSDDVHDWKTKLSDTDRTVIGNVLKGFTSTEIFIQDYWMSKVSRWFKKPEIQMMAAAFGSFESIHADAYSKLGETLNIQEYDAFMAEPTAKAKIDRLMEVKGKTKRDIAKSLAIFSAFNEGVNLFSSFAILRSFAQRDLMKGVGQIIKWSIRDESLHSNAGCWLFREFIKENKDLMDSEMTDTLIEAARLTVQLEDDFIDKAFELGPMENLDAKTLKNYIRFRCNTKLGDLNLKANWRNIDKEALEKLQWFSVLSSGVENTDFFASRVTSYSKSSVNFENVW